MDWDKLYKLPRQEAMKAIKDELITISNGLFEMNMEDPLWGALDHIDEAVMVLKREIDENE